MEIVSTEFVLGDQKISLKDEYDDIDRLVDKTGIPAVYQTDRDIISFSSIPCKQIIKNFDKNEINILILVTQSPEDLLPANSISLSNKLNLPSSVFTFDFNQGCSGFVQSFLLMSNVIKKFKTGLIVTVDRYRSKLNPKDRSTNAVFSDGAAAIILKENKKFKIHYDTTLTDGSKRDWLYQSTGSENGGFLHMSGSEIWLFTRKKVVPQIEGAIMFCLKNNLSIEAIYIHQASKVVVEGIKDALGVYGELILENYMHYGNTVSSTIPILINDFPISKQGGVVIMSGFGVGLTSTTIVYGNE